jgi:hypothetical protein
MRLCGPSRTRVRKRRVDMGSTQPVRRFPSCGHSASAPAFCRSVRRPSVDFHSSSEFLTGNPCRPAGCPAGQTTLPLLDFCCPTTQSQAGGFVSRQRIPPPPGPRSRFGYLLRDAYLRPSRRLRVGASMGFTLQGLPLAAIGTPLGAHAILPLPAACSAHRAKQIHAAGFRALFLQRVRSVTRVTNDLGRRFPPGVRPSRACSHPTWRSLSVAAPPLSPFGGLTSRPAWASGYCGTYGWVDPSPDRQLSWVSLPSDDHSAPFIAPQGGRIALPHARLHADGGGGRSMPLVRDATTDPGPVARHRRQSVCGW